MLAKETIKNLPNNSRFYILVLSVLLSLFTLSLLRGRIPGDQLFYIRLEQVYGFIAVAFLYVALVISPLQKIIGTPGWMKNVLFARRAIGVSAAYFALLHAAVALWGQIGGLEGLTLLPERFTWALAFGFAALVVLLLMAATSFDKAVKFMTYRKWKWLHRFVYAGGILIILHVWMIGTHAAYFWVQMAAFIPISIFFGLEAWRITATLAKRFPELQSKDYFLTLALCLWLVWSTALFVLPSIVKNYHSEHHAGNGAHTGEHRE